MSAPIHLPVSVTLCLAAFTASAQGVSAYNQALQAYQAGKLEVAAPLFFELSETAKDAETRSRAELQLAQSFQKLEMPVSALITSAHIINAGPSHPEWISAVQRLVEVQETLQEQNLAPNILDKAWGPDTEALRAKLTPEARAMADYLVATIRQRRGRFEEARALLEPIPPDSPIHARARYLLGVVLADPRYPGRPAQAAELDAAALSAFRDVLKTRGKQLGLEEARQLALLGLGRVHYGRREYPQAVKAYEAIPRYGRFWDQALFENGFARFQNDDPGGALGSLQSLHAPQFEGAFQPESWILKATVYYYACLYDEVKTTLAAFDSLYGPMAEQLQPYVGDDVDLTTAFNLVAAENRRLPGPVYLWIRGNARMQDVLHMLEQVDSEKRTLASRSAWRGTSLVAETLAALEQVRGTLIQVGGRFAHSRLQEASRNLRTFSEQAELLRVQTAMDEKELLLDAVDQKTLLGLQVLHRPKQPGASWHYWKFQGEFWRDEIGYYQYTLKRGCPRKRR